MLVRSFIVVPYLLLCNLYELNMGDLICVISSFVVFHMCMCEWSLCSVFWLFCPSPVACILVGLVFVLSILYKN